MSIQRALKLKKNNLFLALLVPKLSFLYNFGFFVPMLPDYETVKNKNLRPLIYQGCSLNFFGNSNVSLV